jgi:hypothetical protein
MTAAPTARGEQPLTTPGGMWRGQLVELRRDLARVQVLTDDVLTAHHDILGAGLRRLLGGQRRNLAVLEESVAGDAAPGRNLWRSLAERRADCRELCTVQLGLLGGLALAGGLGGPRPLDDGFATRASAWVDGLRQLADLRRPLVVIPGRGPVLEPAVGLVRIPFLDWDLWHLPLLGRVLGLVAAAEDRARGGALDDAEEALSLELAARLGAREWPLGWERTYLEWLFADMFATTLLGPAYALAVFTLELDYAAPERQALERTTRHPLPSPAQRAAAILATVRALERVAEMGVDQRTPYHDTVGQLERLWGSAAGDGFEAALATAEERFGACHELLFEEILHPQVEVQLETTQAVWTWARARCLAWAGQARAPRPPRQGPLGTAEVLSALWRYRVQAPEHADLLAEAGQALLDGREVPVPRPGGDELSAGHVVQARLARLGRRWGRVQALLRDERVLAAARTAVTGRFLRVLSEQLHHLDAAEVELAGPGSVPWPILAELERRGRPVQREALEFLGGSLLLRDGLDSEPAALAGGRAGPRVSALADQLLRDDAEATGVNWSARTVLGPAPLLETSTDVIRVRFPDWSIWNLPLLAHEFGHLVARDTPELRPGRFYEADPGVDHTTRERQLEELFADVFATYTLGPAFAADAILLHLDPADAHLPRGDHPAHGERAAAILATLRRMDAVAGSGAYSDVLEVLTRTWTAAVAACGGDPAAEPSALARAEALGRLVETYYRLGAAYTPARWSWAARTGQELASQLPGLGDLRASSRAAGLGEPSLRDLLNVLWAARLDGSLPLTTLTNLALRLGRDHLEGAHGAA